MTDGPTTFESLMIFAWIFILFAVCWFAGIGLTGVLLEQPRNSSARLRRYEERLRELEDQLRRDLDRANEDLSRDPYDDANVLATEREIRETREEITKEEDNIGKRQLIAIAAGVAAWLVLTGLMIELGTRYF